MHVSFLFKRLRFVGHEEDRIQDFWCDLTKVSVHPLGWCAENSVPLLPPDCLKEKFPEPESALKNLLIGTKTVPLQLLDGVRNS